MKPSGKGKYDLEERTVKFSKEMVVFCKKSRRDVVSLPVISQLIRAATSIGANYCEANGASSKKDFKNKIHICKKEAQETKYWLRIIAECDDRLRDEAKILWKEAQELTLIFGKIVSSLKN